MFDKKRESESGNSVSASHTSVAHPPTTPPQTGGASAIIGASICINGDVSGEESLLILGRVDGKILLKNNNVTVGKSGKVTANISAKMITIEGEVTGDINGEEKVVIASSGRVRGNIVAPRMTLEDGAKFKGSIDMDPDDASTGLSSKASGSLGSNKAQARPNTTSA